MQEAEAPANEATKQPDANARALEEQEGRKLRWTAPLVLAVAAGYCQHRRRAFSPRDGAALERRQAVLECRDAQRSSAWWVGRSVVACLH